MSNRARRYSGLPVYSGVFTTFVIIFCKICDFIFRYTGMVHYAAGVLPITWHDGQLLFLVGKDMREGYSDFGGKCERIDRGSPAHTAAREFYEETYGSVVSAKALLQHMTLPGRSLLLKSSTQNGYDYYMYVAEIPYIPHLRNSFRKQLRFLQSINMQRAYVEKTDVQYCTWEMLQTMAKRQVFANTIALHHSTMEALARSTPTTWRHLTPTTRERPEAAVSAGGEAPCWEQTGPARSPAGIAEESAAGWEGERQSGGSFQTMQPGTVS